jgi:hypothetical protein
MTIVEIWVDGVSAPFRLEFRERVDAAKMRDTISAHASARTAPDEPFIDDFGQTVGFRLKSLISLRLFES